MSSGALRRGGGRVSASIWRVIPERMTLPRHELLQAGACPSDWGLRPGRGQAARDLDLAKRLAGSGADVAGPTGHAGQADVERRLGWTVEVAAHLLVRRIGVH